MKRLLSIALALVLIAGSTLAQQVATPTATAAHSEAEIQAALTEHARIQRWRNMAEEWTDTLLSIRKHAWAQNDLIQRKIERDLRSFQNEVDQVRLEAKLRGQPEPPSVGADLVKAIVLTGVEVQISANYLAADGKFKDRKALTMLANVKSELDKAGAK